MMLFGREHPLRGRCEEQPSEILLVGYLDLRPRSLRGFQTVNLGPISATSQRSILVKD